MRNTSTLNIARDFKAEPRFHGHPMRGAAGTNVPRQHLLRKDPRELRRRRLSLVRDVVISLMGAVSAVVPILIAIQSVTGA